MDTPKPTSIFSPELDDWLGKVDRSFDIYSAEEFETFQDHASQLRNAQALETPQLATGCTTLNISVPVSYDHFHQKQTGDSLTWKCKALSRVYTPIRPKSQSHGAFPLVVWLRDGLATGDLETEDETCRQLSVLCSCVVLNIGYRKAPENPWPVPLEDAWDVLLWVSLFEHRPCKLEPATFMRRTCFGLCSDEISIQS